MESFGNHAFLQACQDVNKNKSKLTTFLQAFHSVCKKYASAVENDVSLSEGRLGESMGRITICVKGLLSLVSVSFSDASSSHSLRSYDGECLFMMTLKDLLCNPQWTRLFDDLVSKGSGTLLHTEELLKLEENMAKEDISAEDFSACVTRLPILKRAMRAGSTSQLEKVLYKRLVTAGQRLIADQHEKPQMSLVSVVTNGLHLFRETQGVLQLIGKIDAWKQTNMVSLACSELAAIGDVYMEARHNHDEIPEDNYMPALQKLLEGIRQLDTLSLDILSSLQHVFWWHFRVLAKNFEDQCGANNCCHMVAGSALASN